MTYDEFAASLAAAAPTDALPRPLRALWHLAKGDWASAHELVQADEGNPACDWVHAHLHRVEGDLGNAGYWYRRAGRTMPRTGLAEERQAITAELLAAEG